jgi:hypothetical protein
MVPEEKILLMKAGSALVQPTKIGFIRRRAITRFRYLCFFAFVLCASCENDLKKVDRLFEKKTGVEEARQIESYFSEAGRVKAKLTAPLMKRYMIDSSFMEFPQSLHVDFYDDSIKIESTLDALYAKYMESQRKIFLRSSLKTA